MFLNGMCSFVCEWEALHTVLCSKAAAIHFEKVARREIGAFTSPKTKTRSKMLAPPHSGKEPIRGYSRMPISYSILDSIGHCFQVSGWCTAIFSFPVL